MMIAFRHNEMIKIHKPLDRVHANNKKSRLKIRTSSPSQPGIALESALNQQAF
jgi:hypothetical protein